jgi:hypothetical protein
LNYYVTVAGDVYINDKLVNTLLNDIKIGDKTVKTKLKLTSYTQSVIMSLENKTFKSLGDFVAQLNQIIFAATGEKNIISIGSAIYNRSYYAIYSKAIGSDVTYAEYAKLPGSNLKSIGELFVVSVRRLYQYQVDASKVNAATSGMEYTSSFYAATGNLDKLTAKKIFQYNMPALSGRINYINLSSIMIYTVSVSTSIVDTFSADNLASDNTSDIFITHGASTANFNKNPFFILDDTIYIAGGVKTSFGEYNYIGSAEKDASTIARPIYHQRC